MFFNSVPYNLVLLLIHMVFIIICIEVNVTGSHFKCFYSVCVLYFCENLTECQQSSNVS